MQLAWLCYGSSIPSEWVHCFAEVVHTVLSEIGTALAAPSVKLMAFQNLHVLAGMFKIMWQLHRVSTHVHQRDGHIEYESTACLWTLQLEVKASLQPVICFHAHPGALKHHLKQQAILLILQLVV